MTYSFDWSVVLNASLWWHAFLTTLTYAVATFIAGSIVGIVCGLALLSRSKVVYAVINFYVQLFRCTPLVVQIVWLFYALPMLTGVRLPEWVAAGGGLTLYCGAFCTEIFRAGIMSIDRGQWNAARAVGLSYPAMMRYIILPQAIRRMVPPFVSQAILNLKNTSLLYVVAVPDLMYRAQEVTSSTYRPLEAFTFVAAIYFFMLWPLTIATKRLERREFPVEH